VKRAVACALLVLLAGCEAPQQKLSTTQWQAIETREVDGRQEDVLRAVAAVVLDKGYYYAAADKDAGLLTAAYVPVQASEIYCRSGGMTGPVLADVLGIWVRQSDPSHCEVRLQRLVMGQRVADEGAVTQFCVAVQRRMLGGDAATDLIPAGAARAATDPAAASAPAPANAAAPVPDDLNLTGSGPGVRP
jgi:hypothetical protein